MPLLAARDNGRDNGIEKPARRGGMRPFPLMIFRGVACNTKER